MEQNVNSHYNLFTFHAFSKPSVHLVSSNIRHCTLLVYVYFLLYICPLATVRSQCINDVNFRLFQSIPNIFLQVRFQSSCLRLPSEYC